MLRFRVEAWWKKKGGDGRTLLHKRQPGMPRSLAKDQNWREVEANMPTDVHIPMVVMMEHMAAVPATERVAWKKISMNG
jgi:hypothetical protein